LVLSDTESKPHWKLQIGNISTLQKLLSPTAENVLEDHTGLQKNKKWQGITLNSCLGWAPVAPTAITVLG